MSRIEQGQSVPNSHDQKSKSLFSSPITRRQVLGVPAAFALATLVGCQVEVAPEIPNKPENKLEQVWSISVGPQDKLTVDQSGLYLGSGTEEVSKLGLNDGQVIKKGLINKGTILGIHGQNLYLANSQGVFTELDNQVKKTSKPVTQTLAVDKDTLRPRWIASGDNYSENTGRPRCYVYKGKLIVDGSFTKIFDEDSGKVLLEGKGDTHLHPLLSNGTSFSELADSESWLVNQVTKRNALLSIDASLPRSSRIQETFQQDQLFDLETFSSPDFLDKMSPYLFDMHAFGVNHKSALYNLSTSALSGVPKHNITVVDMDSKTQKWYKENWQFVQAMDSIAITRTPVDELSSAASIAGFEIESGKKLWETSVMPDITVIKSGDQLYGVQTLIKKQQTGFFDAKAFYYLNLLKLNQQTGEVEWSTSIDGGEPPLGLSTKGEATRVTAKRIVGWVDNQYIVVAGQKNIYLLNSENGKILGKSELWEPLSLPRNPSQVPNDVSAANDHEVFIGLQNHLFVLDKSKGSLRLERYFGKEGPISEIATVEKKLLVKVGRPGESAQIYCYA
jgi:outer membrane protein assembly factor BamB